MSDFIAGSLGRALAPGEDAAMHAGRSSPLERLRVLVADPDEAGRSAVRAALEEGGLVVCTEAGDVPTALAAIRRDRPDACLLDSALAEDRGGVVAAILEAAAGMPVVMLSACPTDADLLAAVAAGAWGHLRKDLEPRALTAAIGDVVGGRNAFPRRLETLLAAGLRAAPEPAS